MFHVSFIPSPLGVKASEGKTVCLVSYETIVSAEVKPDKLVNELAKGKSLKKTSGKLKRITNSEYLHICSYSSMGKEERVLKK